MAIVKFVNSKPKIKKLINYVNQRKKVYMLEGKDCVATNFYNEVEFIKNLYNKKGGREFIHIVHSFSNKENVIPEQAHRLSMQLAEYFKGYQVLVATHIDKAHIHSHLIVNSVSFETGKKYQQSKQEMQQIKEYSNKLCLEEGLSVIKKKTRVKDIKQNEYRAMQRGSSWKQKLMEDIDMCKNKSKRKYEFINSMQELGYKVKWTKERKYITYTTKEGKKCRDIRLHYQEYLKENMEEYFEMKKNNMLTESILQEIISKNQDIYCQQFENGYKGELSEQAKKDFAINKEYGSSIEW